MKILVINAGSSSVKFQLFDMALEEVLCKGRLENIGSERIGKVIYKVKDYDKIQYKQKISDHHQAFRAIFNLITNRNLDILNDIQEIQAIGHRVVHGGEEFAGPCLVNNEVLQTMEACSELAPLHNPPNIAGIRECQKILPDVPQVAVFDTAFHQTMPPEAYLYGLPYNLYEKYKIRRYGFHGTSHTFCCSQAAKILDRPISELKIITCHLGNGASIAAVKYGKSIDTSMGFTPLEGLVMGTRCGSLDPAIIPFLMEKEAMSVKQIGKLLNNKSGMYGLAGINSYDMRDILAEADKGNQQAKQSVDVYCLFLKKFIGAYLAELGGVDCIVITGGVGENNPIIREKALSDLAFAGVELDMDKNILLSTPLISKGSVAVLVIATNEELVIAREAKHLVATIQDASLSRCRSRTERL
jgi:acetate kinase